ncbi:glycosyltransferase [Sphingomonas sp. DT-204]|uniref:glycosyltransferase n=1 Tax=Sphingomonas sp. DT-204 TaxID=3396166 RepID=UPI003F1AA263
MSSARHILMPIQTLNGGGVEKVSLRLAEAWIGQGRQVTLAIGSREGPLADEIPEGAACIEVGDSRYMALLGAIPRIVREVAPDVLFCPGNHYTSIAGWTWLRLGSACPPIAAKVSNALVRRDMGRIAASGYRAWLRLHPRFVDALVAMTPGMADEAVAAMRMPRERLHVIPNPAPRQGTGEVPAGRYLLGIGRLAPQKRWDRAIAAIARIADRQVRLVIYGEGPERAALERQVQALGLSGRVQLPGYVADPSAAIAGAVAVVLTSDFEGVPGVLREALAAGTPVVSTDSSVAVREIVARVEQGSVVPIDDADALVAALDHWLAPGRGRPAPVGESGDPAAAYASLFDSLVSPTPSI